MYSSLFIVIPCLPDILVTLLGKILYHHSWELKGENYLKALNNVNDPSECIGSN